jgi:hypothetical protein
MPQPINVNIAPDDVHRIIQALDFYLESWQATEICRRHGYQPDDSPVHVDCFDPDEAHTQALKVKGVLRRFHLELDRISSVETPVT